MILRQLKLKGIGDAFPDRIELDFDKLPKGVICVVGSNGSGKSHLLESTATGVLYRQLVGYGDSISDHIAAGVRDAHIDLTFDLGATSYRAVVQCDPAAAGGRGKSEAYLYRDGQALAGPLVRDYDAAIASILPPKALFCASVFGAQGGGGSFFALGKSQRKDLFVKMLGLEHLQVQSEQARSRAQSVLAAVETLRTNIEVADRHRTRKAAVLAEAADLATKLQAQRIEVGRWHSDLDALRTDYTQARESLARAEHQRTTVQSERTRIEREAATARENLSNIEEKIRGFEALLADRAEIEQAAASLAVTLSDLSSAQQAERERTAALQPIVNSHVAADAELTSLKTEYARLQKELTNAKAALERAAGYDDTAAELAKWKGDLARANAEISTVEERLTDLDVAAKVAQEREQRREVLKSERKMLEERTLLLKDVDIYNDICGRCPLTADAQSAVKSLGLVIAKLAKLPDIADETSKQRQAFNARLRELRQERDTAQKTADRLSLTLQRLEADRAAGARCGEFTQAIVANVRSGKDTAALVERLKRDQDIADQKFESATNLRKQIEQQRKELQPLADRAPSLAVADAQWSEQVEVRTSCQESIRSLSEQLASLVEPDLTAFAVTCKARETAVEQASESLLEAESAANKLSDSYARLDGEAKALGDPESELKTLRSRYSQLSLDAGDWAVLEKALGRDGVQALEIDAAGPGVTAIANDILHTCAGDRFALKIETTEPKKAGGGQKEIFDVRVLDAENPLQKKEKGSPGQMAMLDEALRLALAIYNTNRSGYELRTLWRDEADQALTVDHAHQYLAMLRRAQELGGFDRVLCISHKPDIYEAADGRICVEGGRVNVQ